MGPLFYWLWKSQGRWEGTHTRWPPTQNHCLQNRTVAAYGGLGQAHQPFQFSHPGIEIAIHQHRIKFRFRLQLHLGPL